MRRTPKRTPDPRDASLRVYRRRNILLERQVARLLAASPYAEQEKEIARLEQRCIDLEDRWEEAETECYRLRKRLLLEVAG